MSQDILLPGSVLGVVARVLVGWQSLSSGHSVIQVVVPEYHMLWQHMGILFYAFKTLCCKVYGYVSFMKFLLVQVNQLKTWLITFLADLSGMFHEKVQLMVIPRLCILWSYVFIIVFGTKLIVDDDNLMTTMLFAAFEMCITKCFL